VSEPPVINASPLIYLAHADLTDLLLVEGNSVRIPVPVSAEIRQRGPLDPTVQVLDKTPWLEEVSPVAPAPRVAAWNLGPGETSVLSWALAHPGCVAILDDLAGRRCAETLDIPLIGTLGLVLKAKRFGRVPAARPVIDRLRDAGMYLSDRILNPALALVGE
jgi:predicted nucleic acid-binding protein